MITLLLFAQSGYSIGVTIAILIRYRKSDKYFHVALISLSYVGLILLTALHVYFWFDLMPVLEKVMYVAAYLTGDVALLALMNPRKP